MFLKEFLIISLLFFHINESTATFSKAEEISKPKIIMNEPGEGNVIAFQRIGKLIAAMTYANIEISVSVKDIINTWRRSMAEVKDRESKLDPHHQAVVVVRRKQIDEEIKQVAALFSDLVERVKRGFITGAVVTTLLSGAASLLFARSGGDGHEYIFEKHRSRINDNSRAIKALTSIQESSLKNQLLFDELVGLLDVTEAWITQVRNGFEHIIIGVLLPDLVDSRQLRDAVKNLFKKIKEKGYETIQKMRFRDYFQLPLSAVIEDGQIIVIIHVPIHLKGKELELYQFIDMPWAMRINGVELFFQPSPGKRFIAVAASSREHQELTDFEMSKCHKIKDTYFCGGQRTFKHDFGHSCLGSLYSQFKQGIRAQCKLVVQSATEEVVQTDSFEFRFMIPTASMMNIRCDNHNLDLSEMVRGVVVVTLPPTCRAETKQLSVARSPSTGVGVSFRSQPLALPVEDLLPEDFSEWRDVESKFKNVPVHVNLLEKEEFEAEWEWQEIATIVLASTMTLLALYIIVVTCWGRRGRPARNEE